jgi:hypothetical protein
MEKQGISVWLLALWSFMIVFNVAMHSWFVLLFAVDFPGVQ